MFVFCVYVCIVCCVLIPLTGTAGSNPAGGMDVCLLCVLCFISLLAGVAGSNPAGGMDVCCVCCVLSV